MKNQKTNRRRKVLALVLSLVLMLSVFVGCTTDKTASETSEATSTAASEVVEATSEAADEDTDIEPVTIRLGGLKGPTTMGMVKLLDDAEKGETFNTYEYTMAAAADELTPKLINGELDIIAVPANLASVLYNNTEGKVQMLAVNTLGVLYILENGEGINSMEDLKGQTIYATGKGTTPEYTLNYILSSNGLDPETDVTIEWKSEPTEVVAMMSENEGSLGMLPQPFATVAQSNLPDARVVFSLTEEWNKVESDGTLLTGVLVVRREFAEENPAQVDKFLEEYMASTQFVNDNVAEAAALIEKYDIVKAAVAEKAIPFCNITYIAGSEMKTAVDGYLEVLYNQNPKSVGGKLPAEDFYYGLK